MEPGQAVQRQRLWLALRLSILALGLAGLAWWIDGSKLSQFASTVPSWAMFAVLLGGTSSRLVCTTRWRVLAGGLLTSTPSIGHLYRLGLLAEFVNLWVPSSLGGEAVRIWGLREQGEVAHAAVSVAVDRVFGLCGLILSLLPLAFLIELPFPSWILALAVLAVVTGVGAALHLRHRIANLGSWATGIAGLSGGRVLWALLLSASAPWCVVAGFTAFFSALHPASLGEIAGFVLITRFGRAIPVSVLGMNSVEGSMLLLGSMFGIPNEVVALAVVMNVTDKMLNSLLGGTVELVVNGREGLRSLRRESRRE